MKHAILLLSASDRPGISAVVTDFIFRRGGNIVDADQHADKTANIFFMRLKWELEGFQIAPENIQKEFAPLAEQFQMTWELFFDEHLPRVAIFVSKHLHCLHDLVYRYEHGQLPCKIELIVSNHQQAQKFADQLSVDFLYTPITPETKQEKEQQQIERLQNKHIDLICLARYHQILSAHFVETFKNRMINIHHSFLPAFVGAEPYAQAFMKGVKIIGATSHYVTPALDQGPIIEQDIARVNHKHTIDDMIQIGQDLERMVFFRAVRWHLERKILIYQNKTVVFE